jgi:hypothetical protein
MESIEGLFSRIASEVAKIKEKAPQFKEEYDVIEKMGQHAYVLIAEIRARGSH